MCIILVTAQARRAGDGRHRDSQRHTGGLLHHTVVSTTEKSLPLYVQSGRVLCRESLVYPLHLTQSYSPSSR